MASRQAEKPELKHLAAYGLRLLENVDAVAAEHDNPPAPITIEAVDLLINDAVFFEELTDDLAELTTYINKKRMRLAQAGGSYLKTLKREDYVSPQGKIEIGGKWHVNMPETHDDKLALFQYLKDRKVFDTMATINSKSLNSLYMKTWDLACKADPDMRVLFEIPGVPGPQWNEFTKIKGLSGRNKRKDENDDQD